MKKIFVTTLCLMMIMTFMPTTASAAGSTATTEMTWEAFLADLKDDGKVENAVVNLTPTGGCRKGCVSHSAKETTPDRIQNNIAQYWILADDTKDVVLKNVKFNVTPVTIAIHSGYNNIGVQVDVKNAELQFQTTGNITVENCTFNSMLVTPFSTKESVVVKNSVFNNIKGTYAMKGVSGSSLTVEGCEFNNVGGAFYTGGSVEKEKLEVKGNTFIGVEATRGAIQIADGGDYSNTEIVIEGNEMKDDAPFIRLINTTVLPNPNTADKDEMAEIIKFEKQLESKNKGIDQLYTENTNLIKDDEARAFVREYLTDENGELYSEADKNNYAQLLAGAEELEKLDPASKAMLEEYLETLDVLDETKDETLTDKFFEDAKVVEEEVKAEEAAKKEENKQDSTTTDEKDKTATTTPKTGDENNMAVYMLAMLLALAVGARTVVKKSN